MLEIGSFSNIQRLFRAFDVFERETNTISKKASSVPIFLSYWRTEGYAPKIARLWTFRGFLSALN